MSTGAAARLFLDLTPREEEILALPPAGVRGAGGHRRATSAVVRQAVAGAPARRAARSSTPAKATMAAPAMKDVGCIQLT